MSGTGYPGVPEASWTGPGDWLAVLGPGDRERRIALLDHASYLSTHALREVLVKAKGSYRRWNCTKKREKKEIQVT